MLNYYKDIIDPLGEPKWFDEAGVPRYCEFDPNEGANIYARQICLMEIQCQGCGRPFRVSLSHSRFDGIRTSLEDAVKDNTVHYGDPPNVVCCAAGPTMNSVPRRVLEFWDREHPPVRRPELEVEIKCDWWPS